MFFLERLVGIHVGVRVCLKGPRVPRGATVRRGSRARSRVALEDVVVVPAVSLAIRPSFCFVCCVLLCFACCAFGVCEWCLFLLGGECAGRARMTNVVNRGVARRRKL